MHFQNLLFYEILRLFISLQNNTATTVLTALTNSPGAAMAVGLTLPYWAR
jgi:hypothetical protein